MVVPPIVEPGSWHRVKHPKFLNHRPSQPTKTQIRRYQRMKKTTLEWEQKYYEERTRSIRILHDPMRVADVTPSTKPVLASKVELSSNTGCKGKEVIRKRTQILDDDRLDSIETDDELLI